MCYSVYPVTKQTISSITGKPVRLIKQIGKKQLFIVSYEEYELVYSYRTIIGYRRRIDRSYTLTNKKYSVTTTRQCNCLNHTKMDESKFRLHIKWLTDTGTIPEHAI